MITQLPVTICWLRRDLRLNDNHALFKALQNSSNVLPLFIFDEEILNKLHDKEDKRVSFIYNEVKSVYAQLQSIPASFLVESGMVINVFKKLVRNFQIQAVYTNHDYEPQAIQRDNQIKNFLNSQAIPFFTFKDQVIFEKNEILKDDQTPYTVFTPFSKKWKLNLQLSGLPSYNTDLYKSNYFNQQNFPLPSLQSIGFKELNLPSLPRQISLDLLSNYEKLRDYPSQNGTSRISVHLRFGTVSIRELVKIALPYEKWLNELIWREFYMYILAHFPHVVNGAFKPAYNRIPWLNNEQNFTAWCQGRTGYPLVDAGMRELNQTGYMHNRVRMVTASFLTKHLLTDWRLGEAYFASKLLDFELASNNGGWQWSASSGVDAAPYFRIFNPSEQARKFDPFQTYIKKWIPEINTPEYPIPIVNHEMARSRVLKVFKENL